VVASLLVVLCDALQTRRRSLFSLRQTCSMVFIPEVHTMRQYLILRDLCGTRPLQCTDDFLAVRDGSLFHAAQFFPDDYLMSWENIGIARERSGSRRRPVKLGVQADHNFIGFAISAMESAPMQANSTRMIIHLCKFRQPTCSNEVGSHEQNALPRLKPGGSGSVERHVRLPRLQSCTATTYSARFCEHLRICASS